MTDQTLDYFLNKGALKDHNAADVQWFHAANSKDKITKALQGHNVHYTHTKTSFLFVLLFYYHDFLS